MIAVEFTATKADMAAFQRFVTARIRGSVRSPAYWGVLVLLAVSAGVLISGILGITLDRPTALIVLLLGAIFWWIISRLYRYAALPLDDGSLVGPRRIEIDEACVRQSGALQDGRTLWAGVLSVDVTSTHVFLMTDSLAGYVVPRRAFASPAECDAFLAFARAHAKQRR